MELKQNKSIELGVWGGTDISIKHYVRVISQLKKFKQAKTFCLITSATTIKLCADKSYAIRIIIFQPKKKGQGTKEHWVTPVPNSVMGAMRLPASISLLATNHENLPLRVSSRPLD